MRKGNITVVLAIIFGILSFVFLASTIFLFNKNKILNNVIVSLQQIPPTPTPTPNIYDNNAPAKVDCSNIKDNVCPQWCAPGSDYDCCIRAEYKWVEGRGCY